MSKSIRETQYLRSRLLDKYGADATQMVFALCFSGMDADQVR